MAKKKHGLPGFAKDVLAQHEIATRAQVEEEVDRVLTEYGSDPWDVKLKIYRTGLIEALSAKDPSLFELRHYHRSKMIKGLREKARPA